MECIYRICQDGLRFLLPWITKRHIKTSDYNTFRRFIVERYHDIPDDIPDKAVAEGIDDMSVGCFVVSYETRDNTDNVEPVVLHRFQRNISSMISKENVFSLQLRYLTDSEDQQIWQKWLVKK